MKEFTYLGGRYRTNVDASLVQCLYADGKYYVSNSIGVMLAAKKFLGI